MSRAPHLMITIRAGNIDLMIADAPQDSFALRMVINVPLDIEGPLSMEHIRRIRGLLEYAERMLEHAR